MSTKTTFKRIALVAVAALGLGVLSVAPSSATPANVAVTVTNGSAGAVGSASDTTTGATISVTGLLDAGTTDTITVSFIQKGAYPAGAVVVPVLQFLDTTTPLASTTKVFNGATNKATFDAADSVTAGNTYTITGTTAATATYAGANFALYLESTTSGVRKAGTYSYTVIVKSFATTPASTPIFTGYYDANIVVAAASNVSKTLSLSASSAYIGATSGATSDSAVSAVSTADSTDDAFVQLNLLNAAGGSTTVTESVTATVTGAGLISFDGTTYGKSITVAAVGSQSIRVRGDGTAGTSTIAISTPSGFTATKSLVFYAKAAKTITASVNNPVLVVGTNTNAIKATAVDANGVAWTGQLYVYAVTAADALIGGSATAPVPCAYSASKAAHFCPVSTIAAGTASFKVIDAATVATMNASSDAVAVKVSAATPATVKIAFDKATYQPFEKAYITVTPVDSTGVALGGQAFTNLFATGGITSTQAFGSQSDTLTSVALTTSADASSSAPRTAGAFTYTVYMPAQGTVTISATGGSSLPLAGQVAVSASATIANSAVDAATDAANEATDAANAATDAALAAADAADAATAAAQDASDAVAALSASVEKLVASLKAQITSLTNLVIKIQKKVKA
jgi:trimeric autotransporter adhesin